MYALDNDAETAIAVNEFHNGHGADQEHYDLAGVAQGHNHVF